MSLYEALDNFVGAGVLTCAPMVGVEIAAGHPLDGADFSRHLRAHRLGDTFGAALDGLAHAIWMVQEQRGFSQSVSEAHAIVLGRLLSDIRLDRQELMTAIDRAKSGGGSSPPAMGPSIAEAWLAKAAARGALAQPGIIEDVARFILGCMFTEIADRHRLLEEVTGALRNYVAALATAPTPAPAMPASAPPSATTALPQPAIPASPSNSHAKPPPSTAVAVRPSAANAVRAPLPGVLEVAPVVETPAISPAALQRFQAILAQHPMTAQQRQARLDELSAWLNSTVAHLRRPSNAPAEMQRIRSQAAAALEAGELERAMEILKSIRERLRDERRGAEARIAEELSNLRLTMLDEAAATARLGELAMARMEFATAAEFFADAAGQLPAKENGLEYDYRQRHAEALAGHAETTGDARVLEAAAQAFRQCRRLLVRERDPGSWVRASVGLGDMLMGLASRSSHPEIALEEAVVSFAEAAEVIDRNAKPRQWGLVQMSYASALVEQGRHRDRERNWSHAATVLMQTLEILEPLGARELAASARQKLQEIAGEMEAGTPQAAPLPLKVVG